MPSLEEKNALIKEIRNGKNTTIVSIIDTDKILTWTSKNLFIKNINNGIVEIDIAADISNLLIMPILELIDLNRNVHNSPGASSVIGYAIMARITSPMNIS